MSIKNKEFISKTVHKNSQTENIEISVNVSNNDCIRI